MKQLPRFILADYENMLSELRREGFLFEPVAKLESCSKNTVYLRHDVDFSVDLTIGMAEVEHTLGISARRKCDCGNGRRCIV